MAGRTRKFNPVLSEQDKATLEKIVSSRTEEIRKVQRAKMILLAASGSSNTDIANNLGISRPVVNKIIKRFSSAGVQAALEDAARPGRPKELDPEQQTWIISLACSKPRELPDGPALELWTLSALTNYVRSHCKEHGFDRLESVAASTIWYLLNKSEIKPHRIRYYLEKKDEQFEAKAKEVLLLYKKIEWITLISLKYANGLRNGANSDTHRCKQLTEHGEERCIKLREVAGFSAVRTIFQIVGPRKILHCLLGK